MPTCRSLGTCEGHPGRQGVRQMMPASMGHAVLACPSRGSADAMGLAGKCRRLPHRMRRTWRGAQGRPWSTVCPRTGSQQVSDGQEQNEWGRKVWGFPMHLPCDGNNASIARPTTARQNTASWPNQGITQSHQLCPFTCVTSGRYAFLLFFLFFLLPQQFIVFYYRFYYLMFKILI